MNKIKENKTDYVILAEKTARLFKVAFQRILKKYGIPAKVISFTPDYFEEEKYFGKNIEFQKNKKEKIDKLKKIFNNEEEDLKIMVVDEFYDLGRVKDKMFDGLMVWWFDGLMDLGIDGDNIDYMEIENKNILEGNPVLETVYYEKTDIFKNDKEGVFHPVFKGEYGDLIQGDTSSAAVKYKKTSKDIWKIFDNIDESKFH